MQSQVDILDSKSGFLRVRSSPSALEHADGRHNASAVAEWLRLGPMPQCAHLGTALGTRMGLQTPWSGEFDSPGPCLEGKVPVEGPLSRKQMGASRAAGRVRCPPLVSRSYFSEGEFALEWTPVGSRVAAAAVRGRTAAFLFAEGEVSTGRPPA